MQNIEAIKRLNILEKMVSYKIEELRNEIIKEIDDFISIHLDKLKSS